MAEKQRRAKGEGGIYNRKYGRYEGRYTVQTAMGAKRKAVYAKTHAGVAPKLAEALTERENGLTFYWSYTAGGCIVNTAHLAVVPAVILIPAPTIVSLGRRIVPRRQLFAGHALLPGVRFPLRPV